MMKRILTFSLLLALLFTNSISANAIKDPVINEEMSYDLDWFLNGLDYFIKMGMENNEIISYDILSVYINSSFVSYEITVDHTLINDNGENNHSSYSYYIRFNIDNDDVKQFRNIWIEMPFNINNWSNAELCSVIVMVGRCADLATNNDDKSLNEAMNYVFDWWDGNNLNSAYIVTGNSGTEMFMHYNNQKLSITLNPPTNGIFSNQIGDRLRKNVR